jgi:hypothetical protein
MAGESAESVEQTNEQTLRILAYGIALFAITTREPLGCGMILDQFDQEARTIENAVVKRWKEILGERPNGKVPKQENP